MEYMGKIFSRLSEQDLKFTVYQNGDLYSMEKFHKPAEIEMKVLNIHSLEEAKKKCLENLNGMIHDKYPN